MRSPSLFFVARTARRAAHRGPGRPQVRPPPPGRGSPPAGGPRAPAARVEGRGARARLPRLRVQWMRCVCASLVIARQRSSSLLYYLIVRTSL